MTEKRPILLRAVLLPFAAISAMVAMPASADVLEVSSGEARWVVGGPLEFASAAGEPPAEIVVSEQIQPTIYSLSVPSSAAIAHGVPAEYAGKVAELAARYDLSPALIESLVWQESRWRPNAVSPKGARGLAQLMPGTARELGVDADDPFANLEGGARYLREQLDRFDGDLEKALAAYNAGPGRVQRAGGIPRITETQKYVAAILQRLNHHGRKEDQ